MSRWPIRPAVAVAFAVVPVAAFLLGCGLPRDPEGTLATVRATRIVRVGVAERPPWVIRIGEEAGGVEAELLRRFADRHGARVVWHWGGVDEHLTALEHFDLDLVAAGLEKSSPWSRRVALTRPYYREELTVGAPPRARSPEALAGREVAVAAGTPAVAHVRRAEALPVPLDHLPPPTLIAGPSWRLAANGLVLRREPLHRIQHVLAVPPGENAWLVDLERFLAAERGTVDRLLRREAERR